MLYNKCLFLRQKSASELEDSGSSWVGSSWHYLSVIVGLRFKPQCLQKYNLLMVQGRSARDQVKQHKPMQSLVAMMYFIVTHLSLDKQVTWPRLKSPEWKSVICPQWIMTQVAREGKLLVYHRRIICGWNKPYLVKGPMIMSTGRGRKNLNGKEY